MANESQQSQDFGGLFSHPKVVGVYSVTDPVESADDPVRRAWRVVGARLDTLRKTDFRVRIVLLR